LFILDTDSIDSGRVDGDHCDSVRRVAVLPRAAPLSKFAVRRAAARPASFGQPRAQALRLHGASLRPGSDDGPVLWLRSVHRLRPHVIII